jgi:hypothetical protein
MTPSIFHRIADVLDAIVACHDRADDGTLQTTDPEWGKLADAGDALSIALGIGAETTWQETATALRTHATLTPELPEGWAWETGTTMTHAISRKPREPGGVRSDGCNIWINGSPGVDAEAVRAVLARAGVGS